MKLANYTGGSGSLHRFVKKRQNKSGATIEYPLVEGTRNPDEPAHWFWNYSFKTKDGDRWKSNCYKVKPELVPDVIAAIRARATIAEILAIVK